VESGEPANLNVLAGLGSDLVDEIGDFDLRLANPLLVEKNDPAEVGLHFSSNDLGDERLGLARASNLALELQPLRVDRFCRERLSADGDRRGRGNVLSELLRENREVVGSRDEIGFAIDLDERRELAVVMDVARDETFARAAVGAGLSSGDAGEAQLLDREIEIALGGVERRLAMEHAGAGSSSELLDLFRVGGGHEKILIDDGCASGETLRWPGRRDCPAPRRRVPSVYHYIGVQKVDLLYTNVFLTK